METNNVHDYKKNGQPMGTKLPDQTVINDTSGRKTCYPTDYCSQVIGTPEENVYLPESSTLS